MMAAGEVPKGLHKRNIASLVGGAATAVAVFIGVILLSGNLRLPTVFVALALAIAVGAYIRLADL